MSDILTQAAQKNTTNIFQELRDGFAFIASNATHVAINHDKLEAYAKELMATEIPETFDDTHHFVSGDLEWDLGYVLLLDSINFGSAYYDFLLQEGSIIEGEGFYFSIASRLKKRFQTAPLSPAEAANISKNDLSNILGLTTKTKSQELAQLYTEAMNEMGQAIQKYGEHYLDYIDAMDGSAAKAVEMLAEQSKFRDIAEYKGRVVKFYKRAQITAADLQLSASHNHQSIFNDADQFTLFADNAVPHVLWKDGLLSYAPELANDIAHGKIIPLGSEAEIEIRGCAAHVVELLSQLSGLSSMDIDHKLWHRSESNGYDLKDAHRTPCVYY